MSSSSNKKINSPAYDDTIKKIEEYKDFTQDDNEIERTNMSIQNFSSLVSDVNKNKSSDTKNDWKKCKRYYLYIRKNIADKGAVNNISQTDKHELCNSINTTINFIIPMAKKHKFMSDSVFNGLYFLLLVRDTLCGGVFSKKNINELEKLNRKIKQTFDMNMSLFQKLSKSNVTSKTDEFDNTASRLNDINSELTRQNEVLKELQKTHNHRTNELPEKEKKILEELMKSPHTPARPTTPVPTTPVQTTPARPTTPAQTTPAQTTPAPARPAIPAPATSVPTTSVPTTPAQTTPAQTTPAPTYRSWINPVNWLHGLASGPGASGPGASVPGASVTGLIK